ncbi:hypothetical protein DFH29DRAFT_1006730 [Suillus ampliporus]|nr:hypothetical protein DFH29DRAFT_1006730 [Suillus ampliporus]
MPPRKPRVPSHSALGQEMSPEESQGAGDKAAHKRKLDDGAGDVSTASKRGRKALMQPQTTGGFKNPFAALESTSAPPVDHNTAPVAHLVPPESILPHPPQSFDAMLPLDQRYDAYMRRSSGPADVPIDPALEAPHELDTPSLIQGYDPDTKRMPPPAANQSIPSTLVNAAIIQVKSPFDTLSTRLAGTNPFNMLSSTRERSATPQNINSLRGDQQPIDRVQELRISPNQPLAHEPSSPKWLTDTITCLENEMKALKEKQDETTDIIDEQAREIDKLRLELQTLHDGHDQLGEDVEKTRTLLDSVSSNVDVITKSLQGSSEPSKSKAARAVSDNSKDNIWNMGVRKCFLKAIGITKPSAIKTCHPHDNGVQIKGDQVRPDFSKDWNENASWHTHLVQYIKHNIRSCHPIVSQELLVSKTDEDILKRLHENFKYYAADYRSANKISLTTGKVKGKIDSRKLEERNHVRPASSLMSAAWDYAFQLAYQSTNESMPSEDDRGGIDPDTDEEKDVRKKPPAKAKGKRKAPSKEPWITHRENYRSLLFNQAMDHLNDLALEDKKFSRRHPCIIGDPRNRELPYVKMGLKIPLGAIDPEWLHAHPQDPLRYNGSIGAPEQAQGLNDEGLADNERELLADEDDEDLYTA